MSQNASNSIPSNPPSKIRIAIVDDHPIFRVGLHRLLDEQPDFEVVAEGEDGADVGSIIHRHKPEILLLDLTMPKVGGLSALEALRDAGLETKAVILTASAKEEDYVRAMKAGARGIILKDTSAALLFKAIRKVQQGEVWLDRKTTAAVLREFASPDRPASSSRDEPNLSKRELEIVGYVAQGFRNKEIASRMFISEQTVKNHLHNVFEKIGVSDRLELALYAIDRKLTGVTPRESAQSRPN
jgi:DNA-binding NarL/FixJ family response regulator